MVSRIPSRDEVLRTLAEAKKPVQLHASSPKSSGITAANVPRLVAALAFSSSSSAGLERDLAGNALRDGAARSDAEKAPRMDSGVLSLSNPRGFGFVNAAGHDDVYIAPEVPSGRPCTGIALKITVVSRSSRGTEVAAIAGTSASRGAIPVMAGVLHQARSQRRWPEPDDSRLRGPIVLSGNSELGADGDAAVVEITRFPEFGDENPEGELITVLGVPGDPNVEVAKILIREQVTEQHPEGAIREAVERRWLGPATSVEYGGAASTFAHVLLPTIDPEDARAFRRRRGLGREAGRRFSRLDRHR